ncbi:malonate transporter subunit MadM [Rhodococcus sp. BP-349]|uniref:malonate transporter subunit MadM n=1 Tax=unclassified Rhodococcus (in: high G+C Gram-positive bacteria) TaxID=192944 RepID=UPI001C9A5134|nr:MULTISPECIES: malonate transporter subunit MadM [unclassified Rhodococcus (in: high G+C Gram-positive bacteria)]MBY6539895.1 malonate transporter subunit MadM [Rhodococcus sp. BP-363]MBY6543777.1 malonate transporter subunit MadM [Rhodococcus sp. BP-369]MBY6563007.1 malonate transporter subunit MadM [Rhodococcus sp. BP-370]MBY6577299.1 malonate transporter subunit MadM [Rhodococcus sp. BP-364]MBY6586600.1 malonate transporter subunit MadM [Rhodococcus sp. BP-358]
MDTVSSVLENNNLLVAFVVVGGLMLLSGWLSKHVTRGRLQGSAIAILVGLALAYWGGVTTGGTHGLADFAVLSGLALMGGSMLRDFAIVSTAFGVDLKEIKRSGLTGVLSILLGVVVSFVVGAAVAWAFGYRDAESLATIGAGAATYIVGPVTGTAVGASSEVIALSVAAGLVKSVVVTVGTPMIAKFIGLNNAKSAMAYGGLMGTTSGVAGGLAATDKRLVPYGAMTATFYTGIGCLLGPSLFYVILRTITGG